MDVTNRQPGPWLQQRGSSWQRRCEAPITGTFRSPRGRGGSMAGSLRLERVVEESGHLWAAGVFTGVLRDENGVAIGIGSRRHSAPAAVADDADGARLVVGPVQVDLLGLAVSIPAFAVRADTGEQAAPNAGSSSPTPWAGRGTDR